MITCCPSQTKHDIAHHFVAYDSFRYVLDAESFFLKVWDKFVAAKHISELEALAFWLHFWLLSTGHYIDRARLLEPHLRTK